MTVLLGMVVLLADWFRRWAFYSRGGDNDNKGQLGVISLILALVFLF